MRVPSWFVLAWVAVLVVSAIGGSVLSYRFVRDRAVELDRVLELPNLPQLGQPSGEDTTADGTEEPPAPSPTESASVAAPDVTPEAPDAGETGDDAALPDDSAAPYSPLSDPRRVTVLLLGIDQRQGEEGPFPTDTIILFSVDPVGQTAAILSIPRDLWVDYPGMQGRKGKINAANILGDEINFPGGGGPMMAVKTVEKYTGMDHIDYYVLINFEVFTALIDVIGPIEVCPPEPIDDDHYPDGSYGYITIHFDAGCQELGSEKLLQYARTRHDDSDIARSGRQQEVILAVRKKVLSLGGVLDMVPEAARLWQALQDNIHTNMSFENMVSLALTAEEIPSENIRRGQITFEEVLLNTTGEGEEVLVPIETDIRLLVEDLFRPAGAPSSREE